MGFIMIDQSAKLRWTQDEAIAYECAREAISDMLTIQRARLADEKAKLSPDVEFIGKLEKRTMSLELKRYRLRLKDHAKIAKIRKNYGAIIRKEFAKSETIAAE